MRLSILVVSLLFLMACGTKKQTVSFQFKRTPLNPIAYHEGVTNYAVIVETMYSNQYNQIEADYHKEVERLRRAYDSLLNVFNNTPQKQQILLQLAPPQLVLPEPPTAPFTPQNLEELARIINIQGMQPGSENALDIRAQFQGFEKGKREIQKKAIKSKEENAPADTTIQYTIPVKNPIFLTVVSPNNQSAPIIQEFLASTRGNTTIRGEANVDTLKSLSTFNAALEKGEKDIFVSNMRKLNEHLNSEFGTSMVQQTALIETFKSTNKHNYNELISANDLLTRGLILLAGNRNDAFQQINAALGIYMQEMQQYNPSKSSRINQDIMKAILKNVIVACIYSENWESGQSYISQLTNMKLKGGDKADLARLTNEFNDLKKRFDALNR
jgi:hypothetical protein